MIVQNNDLCISSYNSTGFGLAAQNHMNSLLLFSDILCVQEHFLIDGKDKKHSNTSKLRTTFGNNHDMFIVPAVKVLNQVSRGRGKGGLGKRSLLSLYQKSILPTQDFKQPNLISNPEIFS